ncbi:hypothetical protein P12x_000784 [Tundrisphaera lichenicola]|uniref:hypothetical protein n=1 Tax=Tundrisphaera lichenicola TaxID=2029860 RepID=UPI003EBFD770
MSRSRYKEETEKFIKELESTANAVANRLHSELKLTLDEAEQWTLTQNPKIVLYMRNARGLDMVSIIPPTEFSTPPVENHEDIQSTDGPISESEEILD